MVQQLRAAMTTVPAFRGGRLIITSSDNFTPAGCFADAAHQVSLISDPEYVDQLVDVCIQEKVSVLIPLIDLDLVRLAPERERFRRIGIELICSDPDVIDLSMDKLRFAHFAALNGLEHPITWTATDVPAEQLPLFYKRRRGFGSIGVGRCDTATQLETLIASNEDLVFQPVIDTGEITIDAYIARGGNCTVAVPRVRDKVVAGESYKTHTVRDPAVSDLAGRTISAMAQAGLRGPLNVQVFTTQPPQLIEVNARLGSASVLANVATQGRFFESILMEAAGGEATGTPDEYLVDLSLSRFLGDVFHQGDHVLEIQPSISAI